MIDRIKSKIPWLIVGLSLLVILYFAVFVRSSTLDLPTVLDYDPWWFFRHAKEIVENGFKIPEWDLLSYYPPGRPYEPYQGWPYTIAIMYKGLQFFNQSLTITDVAKVAPLIMVGLTVFVAFFFGWIITNPVAGLVLALFAVLSPTFIGVSMAGYSDSDVVVVFYTFLALLSYFLLIKNLNKKLASVPFYLFAFAANMTFIFSWGAGWLPSILMVFSLPAFFVYKIVEHILHERRFKVNTKYAWSETKPIAIPIIGFLAVLNAVGFLLGFSTMFHSFLGGLGFTGLAGEPLIVNISVAELQKINIFTRDGFLSVANRVGMLPTILTLIGLPLWFIYKLYKRHKISFFEIFVFVWAFAMFYLILSGVRFSLLFSMAASTAAAYIIGNLYIMMKDKNPFLFSLVFGVVLFFSLTFVLDAMATGESMSGLAVGQNWYDALDWLKANANNNSIVATWWDPGHIIAGYTGLKVHADGAHCPSDNCIPYNHNIRIRDMGRLMTTTDENESIEIVKKYTHLTQEQCNQAKAAFPDKMLAEACQDVSEVYILATDDLIYKYFWMSCFGHFDIKKWDAGIRDPNQLCQVHTFRQLQLAGVERGLPVYSDGQMVVTLAETDSKVVAIMNVPDQGVRNALISEVVYFQNGVMQRSETSGNNTVNALAWVDPSFRLVLVMDPEVKDSVFTKMFFFNGEGLENFEKVYENQQVKIYKAKI